jgi:hypothetical protein
MSGDVTPLSAKATGIEKIAVNDYRAVHEGDVIVQIEHSYIRHIILLTRASSIGASRTLRSCAGSSFLVIIEGVFYRFDGPTHGSRGLFQRRSSV